MPANEFENMYYLGPDGSNAHFAVMEFLKIADIKIKNYFPQRTIKSALENISFDYSSICVLPIENSMEGLVRETIDNIQNLKDNNIKIRGEITIPIKHYLLANTKNKNDIKKIISHPQALAQCSDYIHKNFPHAELKEVSSTSYAAQKTAVEQSSDMAAIANIACASIFSLNILDEEINDEHDNKTRFYILSREELLNKEKGKTAIIFATKNKPGALCDVLTVLARYNINLAYIDSRPNKKHLGEYLFFMELEGFENDYKIKLAIEELLKHVEYFKNLGSFYIY